MAKWLRTTSSRSYVFGGKVIPNSLSGDYLELTDDDYLKMSDNPVLKSLVKTGGVVVHSRKPADVKVSNEELLRENEKLRAELKAAKAPVQDTEYVTGDVKEDDIPVKKGKKGKRNNLVDEA